MAEKPGVSLDPGEATESMFLDDVNCEFKECSFVEWDYQGKIDDPVPALRLLLAPEDGDEVEQYYSMGSPKDWAPSRDGKKLIPVGTATNLRKSANGVMFLESIVNAGFPADDIGQDITVFEGMVAHMVQQPQPKRPGLKQADREDGRERTILLVDEIVSMPGEKKKPKGAPKKGPAKKTPAKKGKEEASEVDIDEVATEAIMEVLAEAGEPVLKKKLPTLVFKKLGDHDKATKSAVSKRVYEDEFLAEGPWTFDADEGTIE